MSDEQISMKEFEERIAQSSISKQQQYAKQRNAENAQKRIDGYISFMFAIRDLCRLEVELSVQVHKAQQEEKWTKVNTDDTAQLLITVAKMHHVMGAARSFLENNSTKIVHALKNTAVIDEVTAKIKQAIDTNAS